MNHYTLSLLSTQLNTPENSPYSNLESLYRLSSRFPDIELVHLSRNHQSNKTSVKNLLLNLSQGRYICFLEQNSFPVPNFLESVLNALNNNPEIDCLTYSRLVIDRCSKYVISNKVGYPYEQVTIPLASNNIRRPPDHACIWKRSLIEDIAFIDLDNKVDETVTDIDWGLKASSRIQRAFHIDDIILTTFRS